MNNNLHCETKENKSKSFIRRCLVIFIIIMLITIGLFYTKNNINIISDDLVSQKFCYMGCFNFDSAYIDNISLKINNTDLIDKYTKETEEVLSSINKRYINNLENLFKSYNNSLGPFANSLAERKVSKESCKILIKYLVKGKSDSNDYLNGLLLPEINDKFSSLMNDINKEMIAVQKEYSQTTQNYAYQVYSLIPSNSIYKFDSNFRSSDCDFESSYKNLNDICFELPSFACDFYSVISSKLDIPCHLEPSVQRMRATIPV